MLRTSAGWSLAVLLSVTTVAQEPKPKFEVASVKKQTGQLPPEPATSGPRPTFNLRNRTLASLIQYAYRLHDFELLGGPGWVRKDLFEVVAKPSARTDDEGRLRLRSLLEERFQLVLREESREMRFYALVLARKDGRLGPDLLQCDPAAPVEPRRIRMLPGALVLGATCQSLTAIVVKSAEFMGAPVVDRTGLSGRWSYLLLYPSEQGADWPELRDLPRLDVGLQNQFGLKLEPQRGPVKVMVIESVQQPTEN